MYYFIASIAAFVLVIFWCFKPRLQPLIELTVSTDDGYRYTVHFRSIHPEAKPIELVFLCLHLAAKLLFIIGNDARQAIDRARLIDLIEQFGNTDLTSVQNAVAEASEDMCFSDDMGKNLKSVVALLACPIGKNQRKIHTKIPLSHFQMQYPRTFLAAIQFALANLDEKHRECLRIGLQEMASAYRNGMDPSALSTFHQVPDIACHIANQ